MRRSFQTSFAATTDASWLRASCSFLARAICSLLACLQRRVLWSNLAHLVKSSSRGLLQLRLSRNISWMAEFKTFGGMGLILAICIVCTVQNGIFYVAIIVLSSMREKSGRVPSHCSQASIALIGKSTRSMPNLIGTPCDVTNAAL